MTAIILTIHAMIVLALVGVVLLQRSEGGALGMGGGGGGLMSGRAAATALTRSTTILAALFFASSLTLAFVTDRGDDSVDFLPIDPEQTLEEDDFSDILGAPEEGEDLPDAFELPADLGAEPQAPAPSSEPEEEEQPQEDPGR